MTQKFDLVVLGSGPAGQRAAVQAAKLKKTVLIVEKNALGGSCLHLGTLPSKTLRESALLQKQTDKDILNVVMKAKERVISREVEVIENQLTRNHVEQCSGIGVLVTPHQVQIGDRLVEAEKIIIATGTRPSRPPNMDIDNKAVLDSDSVLEMKVLPRTLAVIGAGVIGCEYASIFARLGVQVTIIDRRSDLLRAVDLEIVERLQEHFQGQNITLKLGQKLGRVESQGAGACVELGAEKVCYDTVLVCMGRSGNSDHMGLEGLGIAIDPRGMISVNQNYQTSLPHIYAVGDVIGPPALAASSSEQGRLAACHAFGAAGGEFPKFFPYGIYTIPEISTVGLQESEALQKQLPLVIGRARYKELARGQILNDEHGMLKLIFHAETRKLLGAHIIGSQATDLIPLAQMALAFDADVDFFVGTVFNYPTLAEAYKVASYNALNQFQPIKK